MNEKKQWLRIFLISLLFTILTVIFINLKNRKSYNSEFDFQTFENQILDKRVKELESQGYKEVSYELNKIIQEMQKHNLFHNTQLELNSNIEKSIIKKYDFYAKYYKIKVDNTDIIFTSRNNCKEFIKNIKQYTNQEYKIVTVRLAINNETSNKDLENIIVTKKQEYEKAKAEEEARKKAEQEAARKRAEEAAAAKKKASTQSNNQQVLGNLSDYQKYAHDLVINNYGWSEYDFQCLVNLWNRESGWNPNSHNSSSGAHGIPQALPASKMASEGSDYYTNGYTQIRWGLKYIQSRYGSPSNAWNHFQSNNWY